MRYLYVIKFAYEIFISHICNINTPCTHNVYSVYKVTGKYKQNQYKKRGKKYGK